MLLAGTALIGVPILLHLIMQRKPRHLEFPALRLVQKCHETNRRQFRLRHLLLLLLRIAAIALLAFALARPSFKFSGSLGSQEAPVAAALVFDAAPRMEYRQENETRLEAAQKLSDWLLRQLPPESQVAVLDTRLGPAAFQVDRAAAASRIERMEPVANSQSLPAVLDEAFRLLKDKSDLARKEIYVFTDLSRAAWPAEAAAQLQQRAAELPEAMIYLIDVGVKNPTDYSLGELRLSAQVLSSHSPLRIDTEVDRLGSEGERTVELYVDNAVGNPEKRGQQVLDMAADGSTAFDFQIANLGPGVVQGHVRIVGQDGLAADDLRYFSVEVRRPWPILVVDPKTSHSYADYLPMTLAPESWRKRGLSRFECATIPQSDLAKTELGGYAAVCLVDPEPLSPAVWDRLRQYVATGGGLAVFLGRNATKDSFNSPDALRLMPAPLVREARRPEGDLHLAPRDLQHPALSEFQPVRGSVPWSDIPVYRYWELGKLAAGTNVIVPYSDGRPALLERTVGDGRVIVMTTPLSDLPRGRPWNLLPVAEPTWPFLILTNQTILYLVGSTDQRLNYYAGETATIQLDATRYQSYLVRSPNGETFPVAVEPDEKQIAVTTTDAPGNYRVQAGGRTTGVDHGFSVNLSMRQTELTRITSEELDALFGEIPYKLARNRTQIERTVSMVRVGRELFPILILLVALILAAEHTLANRFYRE
jgi:hypothetical protein